jgi:hypothetical protein
MSSINNFMDKKIKKYSWIHELNAAAMKAKLLNEAEQYAKHQQFLAEQEQQNLNEAKQEGLKGLIDLFNQIGIELPKTRRAASALRGFQGVGLDVEGAEDESGMGYPDPSGVESLNPNNSDMDGDGQGTANEVASDAQDWEAGDGDATTGDYENLGTLPSFPNVGMTPSPSAPVPPAMFPSGMAPNAVTRAGTEDAVRRGVIPQSHVARTETRRLQDLQNQMAVDAALRAQAQAKSEGKLPASAKEAGRKAGKQAVRDFKSNMGLEAAAREIMARNPAQGPRPSEDDLRRMSQILGRG